MTSDFLVQISNALGISYGVAILLLAIVMIWTVTWKLLALWKSARKGSLPWFVVLGVVNTFGILEILYIYVFSEMKAQRNSRPAKRKRR